MTLAQRIRLWRKMNDKNGENVSEEQWQFYCDIIEDLISLGFNEYEHMSIIWDIDY